MADIRHDLLHPASDAQHASKDPSEKDFDSPRSNTPDPEKVHESPPSNSLDIPTRDEKRESVQSNGAYELKEDQCYDKLAYCWPTWKKWMYLSAIAGIQISMNFNTSVFPNAVKPLAEHFGISQQAARVGQMIYLVFYSFGCELWAPWSEEFGRWPILQLSLFLINVWIIPCSVAPNFGTIVVCRALVRLSSHWLKFELLMACRADCPQQVAA